MKVNPIKLTLAKNPQLERVKREYETEESDSESPSEFFSRSKPPSMLAK